MKTIWQATLYDELLSKSKLPSLKVRRMRSLAIEVYKVINKECPVYLQDSIHIKNNSYSFRYQNIVELPQVRTTSHGLQSFRYAGSKLWNELPDEFRKHSSLNQFKTLISSWSGSSCQCFRLQNQLIFAIQLRLFLHHLNSFLIYLVLMLGFDFMCC